MFNDDKSWMQYTLQNLQVYMHIFFNPNLLICPSCSVHVDFRTWCSAWSLLYSSSQSVATFGAVGEWKLCRKWRVEKFTENECGEKGRRVGDKSHRHTRTPRFGPIQGDVGHVQSLTGVGSIVYSNLPYFVNQVVCLTVKNIRIQFYPTEQHSGVLSQLLLLAAAARASSSSCIIHPQQ